MLHPSTKKLIDRLAQMTAQQKISWVLGERENSIAYETEGYRVLLEGSPPSLRLTDALGSELETATPEQLTDTAHADGGNYADILGDLHSEALRIAKGTETAISAVLQGLADRANEPDSTPLPASDLAPTDAEAEAAVEEPDVVEDVADESGVETDIPDIGKAVATLADEVNNGTKPDQADASEEPTEPAREELQELDPAEPITAIASPADEDAPDTPTESDAEPTTPPTVLEAAEPETLAPPQQPRRNYGAMGGFGDLSAYRRDTPRPPAAEEETTVSTDAAAETPAPVEPTVSPTADLNPGPPPAPPSETARASSLPPNVQAILDEVTSQPPDGPPLPPEKDVNVSASTTEEDAVGSPPGDGESLSLSGITAGIGLGQVKPEETHGTISDQESVPPSDPVELSQTDVDEADEAASDEGTESDESSDNAPGSRFNPWM
ncbi:MAG: hypothetical protein AAFV54_07875 [Pseudomonadota bacterium]